MTAIHLHSHEPRLIIQALTSRRRAAGDPEDQERNSVSCGFVDGPVLAKAPASAQSLESPAAQHIVAKHNNEAKWIAKPRVLMLLHSIDLCFGLNVLMYPKCLSVVKSWPLAGLSALSQLCHSLNFIKNM